MNKLNSDVSVVVRSAGERTLSTCVDLIEAQGVPKASIYILTESPFVGALKRSYEIGIAEGKKWLMCVDADLLLRQGSIHTIIDYAKQLPETVCEVHGHILDKFFGGSRLGGIHLYRCQWLHKTNAVLDALGSPIRPESATLEEMARQGYPWVECPYVVGLHDFEQSYQDILRKTFVHAHKHQRLLPLLVDYWRAGAQAGDMDFEVALLGLGEGIKFTQRVEIDTASLSEKLKEVTIDGEDKPPLESSQYSLTEVERVIRDWKEPEFYRDFFPNACGLRNFVHKNRWHLLNHEIERRGTLRGAIHFAGRLIEVAGRRVQAFVRS